MTDEKSSLALQRLVASEVAIGDASVGIAAAGIESTRERCRSLERREVGRLGPLGERLGLARQILVRFAPIGVAEVADCVVSVAVRPDAHSLIDRSISRKSSLALCGISPVASSNCSREASTVMISLLWAWPMVLPASTNVGSSAHAGISVSVSLRCSIAATTKSP